MTVTFAPAVAIEMPTEPSVYEARLLRRTEVDDNGCWIWQGPSTANGYGSTVRAWHKGWLAHRLAYTVMVGPIPDGLQIDHLCRVRKCINPTHLEAVTQLENLRRQGAAVTHCPRGHEYSPDNIYMQPGTRNRSCRRCIRLRNSRARSAKRALARDERRTGEGQLCLI